MEFLRASASELIQDLIQDSPPLIRAVFGPRQVGKTTAALQIQSQLGWPSVMESADSPLPLGPEWISTHWGRARALIGDTPALLVLDEIQKISGWSEEIKRLWDEDREHKRPLRVIILGSSAMLLQAGLSESLTGRFFQYPFSHWSYQEMKSAFSYSLDEWIYFGGYPGTAEFRAHEDKWKKYVRDSLIETVLARDVLQSQTITKPALLRQLFGLSTTYPAHILSYNKMLGQLQDAGNTTTLAEYLRLLGSAFLVKGISLFSRGVTRARASSPKLLLLNNALVSAISTKTFDHVRATSDEWGWRVENAVGAHLTNSLSPSAWNLTYWRKGMDEIDFVLESGPDIFGIEVKSGRSGKLSGARSFKATYPKSQILLVGTSGIPLEEFFSKNPEEFLR